MRGREHDPEVGDEYKEEQQALLPGSSTDAEPAAPSAPPPHRNFSVTQLILAFVAGGIACLGIQLAILGPSCLSPNPYSPEEDVLNALAPPYVGSTEVHNWPPASPTNADPTLFPTDVGYAGATPTGAEAALIATAPSYPLHTGAPQLVLPVTLHSGEKSTSKSFDLFKSWGNLSPWYSVPRGTFGIDSGPEAPEQCTVTGLHFLHRHGARYPTQWGAFVSFSYADTLADLRGMLLASYGGPAAFATRLNLNAENWTAKGDLDFLNEWYVARMLHHASIHSRVSSGHTSLEKKV